MPVQTESNYTNEYYKHIYSIHALSRNKPQYWEMLKAVYQHMRKLYGKNHKHYERRLTTIFYHAEPPYNLTAIFANEKFIIWSNDPADQERAKQTFKEWQQIKVYYDELTVYCNNRKKYIDEALEILNGKYDGKIIYYKPPNIRWTLYRSGLKIKENYIEYDGKSFAYTNFQKTVDVEAEKQLYCDLFKYLYKQSCKNAIKSKLQFAFDYLGEANKLILQIADGYDIFGDLIQWKNHTILWSNDPADQERTKQTFTNWKSIEQYYNLYVARWMNYKGIYLLGEYMSEWIIKTERKIKREQNDPDSPEARKKRARRHLKKHGYDLRISRKVVFNGKKHQIVKLDTGEIVAGENFNLTIDQVEDFYKELDAKIVRW